MKKIGSCFVLSWLALPALGATRYVVPADLEAVPFGAFYDIQSAVNASVAGDAIAIYPGHYVLTAEVTVTNAITIRGKNGPASTIVDGGGSVRCFNLESVAVVLDGLTITNGHALGAGGGIYCDGTGPVVTNCTITGNSASSGGGMCYGTANNCTITGNSAGSDGGGMYSGTANNCTISSNWASFVGGGMYSGAANNCTISGNSADYGGGGMCYGTARNSVIYYNSGDDLTVSSATNCCFLGKTNGVSGNINSAPLFMDAAAGDYRLQTNSPCIDAGNNAYAFGSTDLQGNPRIFNGTVDMGAYEYADSDGDGLRNEDETGLYGSDPFTVDTDADGFDDSFEVSQNWSPASCDSALMAYIQTNHAAFGLYPSNAVVDVALGTVQLDTAAGTNRLSMQLETSTDQVTWTNAGEAIEWNLSTTNRAGFFRVRAGGL